MADNRQGRSGSAGFSPRLGARDPRLRSNQAAAVADSDLAPGALQRDGKGKTRISALDGIPPLAAGATLAQVVERTNLILRRMQGQ